METIQDRLNKELELGNSIAKWAIGFYVSKGNAHCFDINVPIFDFKSFGNNSKVLIDYLGSMMWINIQTDRVFYGYGGENPPSERGKMLRSKLESIKNNKQYVRRF